MTPRRLLAAFALAAARAAPAAALQVGFSSVIGFAAPGNPFGVVVGDTVRGSLDFDPGAAGDPFGAVDLASDPTLRFEQRGGHTTLAEADARRPGGALSVFLFNGGFDGFASDGVTAEIAPGVAIPTVGVTLFAGFLGRAPLTLGDLTSFAGRTPVPFLCGDAVVGVPAPAAAGLSGLGLLGLVADARRRG